MSGMTRREFGRLAACATAASAPSRFAVAQGSPKVVIVGGGAGGATVAHSLKREAPELDVTLIEANPIYSSSFFSNLFLGGLRSLETLNHSYVGLERRGIKVVHDVAIAVEAARRLVKTRGGRSYLYDRLVLSPGIDVDYASIDGYSREAARAVPHAYTTSAHGKRLLRRQLQAMKDGGTVVIVPPNDPYRCPPGPYERACMIAHYLKTRKPRSKLVLLDPKKSFSKQTLFLEAFDKYYKGIIELNLSNEIDDYSVASLNVRTREIVTKAGKRVSWDVANIIPSQRAGEIALKAGCGEGDWCPVDPENFASKKVPNVYVLGDAAIANEMPKSAYAANSQAKLVASAIIAELARKQLPATRLTNTCWSLLAPDDDVKLGADYLAADGRLVATGGFTSHPGDSAEVRKQNYLESVGWYAAITAEMFALPAPPAAEAARVGPGTPVPVP
jgi:NADPH-dependent 2,4-dienoyl-CoA reductase/sulfur reductase-like enzyme